ncbi:MAG: HlyC/CorC family transporter [Ruminococcaceae bacterium]|nr:HlyC/CorC family transporter [Oscillospiraceae bacterium]
MGSVYIVIMVLLVLLSAYFSATETAFSSLSKTRLKTMIENGDKRAKLTYSLSDEYDKLISTILIGNNIANIALASLGTVYFLYYYPLYGATISTVVTTVAVLIFGEVTPKSIAKDCPEKFAMFSSPFIKFLIWVFAPVNFLFTLWKKLIAKMFRIEGNAKMSQEELLVLVDEVQQEGTIDDDEGDLLRNAIEFTEQKAEDILTHRVDIEAVPVDAEKAEIAKVFAQTQFSRLLVYDETIDNIMGVIHLKDFYGEQGITDKSLAEIMTAPVFAQKSEPINDLLKLLQKNKSHIAVILDEYGGTFGIVTMEDILEELVGEIWDEHDEVIEKFNLVGENTYLVDCAVDFEEFCEFFGIEDEAENLSLNGWVMDKLDKIPEVEDSFDFEHLNVTVKEVDYHRTEKIQVIVNEIPEEEDEEDKNKKDKEDEE